MAGMASVASRPVEIDDTALQRLRDDGQRYTTGRRELLHALAEAGEPLTIPMILRRRPGLAQSSVYRNLAVLEQARLVSRITTGDEHAHYELAEDLTEHHHHHLVCSECGRVSDFTLPDGTERLLDDALHRAADAAGFTLAFHRLDLVGRCATCAPVSTNRA
jgi:Fe2+ or Zn2+ uptake regulation protein